ncbi:MAG: hypothetical protein D6788_06430 [Planctomycetota bacterium]|nr:MAG: hypothetical protein D6788_06430 [Planctomycetota bacterium]
MERAGGKTFSCGLLCEIQPIEGEEPVLASLTQVNVFPLGVAPGKPDITYRLVGFDTNGKRLSQSGGGSVSSGPLRMQIVMMEVEPPAKLAAIGIEYLTPEARKQRIAEQLRNLKTHGIRLSEPIVGKPFAFSLPVPEGRTVDHHQLAGKVVLMSLWASW